VDLEIMSYDLYPFIPGGYPTKIQAIALDEILIFEKARWRQNKGYQIL